MLMECDHFQVHLGGIHLGRHLCKMWNTWCVKNKRWDVEIEWIEIYRKGKRCTCRDSNIDFPLLHLSSGFQQLVCRVLISILQGKQQKITIYSCVLIIRDLEVADVLNIRNGCCTLLRLLYNDWLLAKSWFTTLSSELIWRVLFRLPSCNKLNGQRKMSVNSLWYHDSMRLISFFGQNEYH